MPFPIAIEITGSREDWGLSVRAWRNALKAAHEAEGRYWQQKLLPLHFRAEAKGVYHHQARDRKYLIQKIGRAKIGQVKDGGLVDDVFSGTLKQFMLETGRIRAYPTRVTITMDGPRYIGMVPRNTKQPDKAKEILTVTEAERDELAGVLQKAFDDAVDAVVLADAGNTETVRIDANYTGGPGAGYSTAFFSGEE